MRKLLVYILPLLVFLIALSVRAQEPLERANELFEYNRYADAAKLLGRKVKGNEGNAAMLEQLAFANFKLHRFEQAETYYERVDLLGGLSKGGHMHYAQSLYKNGKSSEAEKVIQSYIQMEPESFVAQLMLRSIERQDTWSADNAAFVMRPVLDLNSALSDFGPVPYRDGIVFTTERAVDHITGSTAEYTNDPYYAVYYAEFSKEDEPEGFAFKRAKPFLTNLNRDDHVGPVAIDSQHNEIFFTLAESRLGRKGTSYISVQHADLSKDRKIKNEEALIDADSFSVAHPALSPSGNMLIYASDRPGGSGGMDLYYRVRSDSGWSSDQNLSPVVNSPLNEVFPYLKDDTTLYFSSDGHAGLGGLDLFVSYYRSGTWTAPINLKAPINSNKDDFGICFLNSKKGLFSSSRDGGEGRDDLYGFVQISELNDTARTEMKGLFEYANLPKDGVSLSLLDNEDNVLGTTQTDSSGYFSFNNLPVDQSYLVRVNEDDQDLLLNSNIYVIDEDGNKLQVMQKEGASTFVFRTLPKDEVDKLMAEGEVDSTMVYDLFGQLFTTLKKDMADIELIAYTQDGAIYMNTFTDSTGYYTFEDLPKDQFLTIKVDPKDSTIYRSSVFYEGEEGIVRLNDSAGQYFKVSMDKIIKEDPNVSKKEQYTVFLNDDEGPIKNKAIALFNDQDEVIHMDKTNAQGAVSIFGTNAGRPYRLLLPYEMDQREDTVEVHLVDRVANTFIDARPIDKLNHVFETVDVSDILSESELDYLTRPEPVKGQVYEKLPGDYSEGMTLYAYDEDGNLVEQVTTDESGNFEFTLLRPDQNYIVRPEAKDAGSMNLLVFDDEGKPGKVMSFVDLQKYVYETLEAERIQRLEQLEEGDAEMPELSAFVKGQIYYELPGDYKEGIKIYAFDEDGNIIDSTYTDGDGNFTFRRLNQTEDFSIRVLDEVDPDDNLKVALYNYDGSFRGLLFLDENMSFKYSKIVMEAASELESEMAKDKSSGLMMGQVYRKLPGDYHDGLTVYAYDEDGNLIDAADVDEDGNFKFTKLAKEQDYLFRFSEEDTDLSIALLDAQGNELDRQRSVDGEWQYSELQMDYYKMRALKTNDNSSGKLAMEDYLKESNTAALPKDENAEYFKFRSIELSDAFKQQLDQMAMALKQNPDAAIKVTSHSDAAETNGDRSYSALRSTRIAQYLNERGIGVDQIIVENWEDKKPVIDCKDRTCTDEERSRNRTSNVQLVSADERPPKPDFLFVYGFNEWKLSEDGEQIAYHLLQALEKRPNAEIEIQGYTDTWGSFATNDRIASLRAKNLTNLLISKGFDEDQVEVMSHGEVKPTGKCILYYPCPVKEREQNRRVEVRLR